MDMKPYVVFAEVVAAGSMTAAARKLRMTPSGVSQIISALERQAGVTLLLRSTRKLALTEAGERCYPHCKQLLLAGSLAASSLEQARDAPHGELRIAAPLGFGAHVAPALAPVMAEWPGLRLRLILDDDLIDLIDTRIDIALRVGWLEDSNWVGRKLCDLEAILCAAPQYLERRGTPETPEDLASHDGLALSGQIDDRQASAVGRDAVEVAPVLRMRLTDASRNEAATSLSIRTATSNQIALQQLCEQGMGIASLFHADIAPALERGSLVRVLPGWNAPPRPLTLVTRQRDGEAAKIRVAVDAFKNYFSSRPV